MDKTRGALQLLFYRTRLRNRNAVLRLDGRTLAYFGAMLVLIGLAGWLYLHQASVVANYAHEIRQLEERKEELHRELIPLRGQAAMLGSLARVQKLGRDAGYRVPAVTERDRQLLLRVEDWPAPAASGAGAPDGAHQEDGGPQPELGVIGEIVEGLSLWLEAPDAGASRDR